MQLDGLGYRKFIEALDKIPLGAVYYDTVMFMSSVLYDFIRRCLFV